MVLNQVSRFYTLHLPHPTTQPCTENNSFNQPQRQNPPAQVCVWGDLNHTPWLWSQRFYP